MQPSKNLVHECLRCIDEERESAKDANRNVCDRIEKYNRKRRKCSHYRKDEEVFIRFGKRTPKQSYVILGDLRWLALRG